MGIHVYILTESSMAISYGVGQYVSLLTEILQNSDIAVSVVEFSSDSETVIIEYINSVRYIHIPKNNEKAYQRTAFYILSFYIDMKQNLVFHLNFECCEELASLLRKYYACSKIVLTIHYSLSAIGVEQNKVFEIERNLINNYCDYVIAISEHRVNYLINECGINKSKIRLIPHGINDQYKQTVLRKKDIRKWLGLSGMSIILYVGRLDECKGITLLCSAFEKALLSMENIHLVIVGDGYMLKPLLKDYKHLLGHITVVGFWNKEDVYQLYLEANIGVIPSFTEELGLVALEMMMFGMPIIANDTTGLHDIFSKSQAGVLLKLSYEKKRESAVHLANSIIYLLRNRIIQMEYSRKARELFMQKFLISDFKTKMLDLYGLL